MKKQQGMILLSTIIMLGLLTLIVLSQNQLLFTQYKALNQFAIRHQSLQALETSAQQLLEKTANWEGRCIIKETDIIDVIQKLQDKKGCAYRDKDKNYQFLIEDLGVFPCLQNITDNVIYSTKHWRLTLTNADAKSSLLQLRVAELWPYIECKMPELSRIRAGVTSWREITIISNNLFNG